MPSTKGKLVLVPTPLQQDLPLEPVALELLRTHCMKEDVVLLVEEHKVARQRWLKWGLPREAIEKFKLFNEHTQEKSAREILDLLKTGRTLYLMSDGGLPAFCDPGQALVDACHKFGINITATPFPNSIALALALSGFSHNEFLFAGFLPTNVSERRQKLAELAREEKTLVIMDTPYRLQTVLKELAESPLKRRALFLATELNSPNEKLFRGSVIDVMKKIGTLNKIEFVIVLSA